jgi:hypothetical protein
MTPGQREWELECLEAVRRGFGLPNDPSRYGKTIHSVKLAGRYPATELVVRYYDPLLERDDSDAFPLWDDLFEGYTGGRSSPHEVATIVVTNFEEE